MRKFLGVMLVGLGSLALGMGRAEAGITLTSMSNAASSDGLIPTINLSNPNLNTEVSSRGGFASVVSDTLADPQVSSAALATYYYTLDELKFTTVSGLSGDLSGSYTLYSSPNPADFFYVPSRDTLISSGIMNGHAIFTATGNLWQITGVLTQTSGRTSTSVPDLTYGGKQISFSATYTTVGTNTNGQMVTIWRQDAAAPEPASLGVLGMGVMGLMGRRRR